MQSSIEILVGAHDEKENLHAGFCDFENDSAVN